MTSSELEIAEAVNAVPELRPLMRWKYYPRWLSPEDVTGRVNTLFPGLLKPDWVKLGADRPKWKASISEDYQYLREFDDHFNLVAMMSNDAQFSALAARLFEFVETDRVAETIWHRAWMLQLNLILNGMEVYIAYEGKTGGRNHKCKYDPPLKPEELDPNTSDELLFVVSNISKSRENSWIRRLCVNLDEHEIILDTTNGFNHFVINVPLESPNISQRIGRAQGNRYPELGVSRIDDNLEFGISTIDQPIIIPLSIRPENLIQKD